MKNKDMTTVMITQDTRRALNLIKARLDLRNLNSVIMYLIEQGSHRRLK